MLSVGFSGLDAYPDSLDVNIIYVRMHNRTVYILLYHWKTSAVNNTVLAQ